ncbi:MAG TPA: SH3 domain-containing protein [Smithellaceae bacterium]|nr:SH3 domain-containing protein [Smithellaceae bacterium]
MAKKILRITVLCLILSGCLTSPDVIRDVHQYRQDHAWYFDEKAAVTEMLTEDAQNLLDEEYNIIHLSVWHQKEPFHALPQRVRDDFAKTAAKPGYGENKRLHPPSWAKKIQHNAALKNYPNAISRGILIRNSNLRSLPTGSPHFNSANGDISAWPFDNLQRSSVAANTPVLICHQSLDKAWILVETSFTFGWVPAEDLAYVDEIFVRTWESGRFAVITRDCTSILDKDDHFLMQASVGHVFPLVSSREGQIQIMVAVADKQRNAVIRRGFVPEEAAAPKPLRFNAANTARIANELIGEPYGWGGMYGHRDCSSMTRDFFSVFGIWLPRHSADQVKEVGAYIDLSGLTPEQKEKTIIEKGVPYLTLLWRKGHVMLYIGQKDGRALIFHNIWGIRTTDLNGREGRKIIGQAVITTLEPGKELSNVDSSAGSLLDNIAAMNILTPHEQKAPAK